jgi:hypothetical protein
MNCPQCQQPPVSEVTYTNRSHIDVFVDESGARHSHDPNKHWVVYRCAKGHKWASGFFFVDCQCGWGQGR